MPETNVPTQTAANDEKPSASAPTPTAPPPTPYPKELTDHYAITETLGTGHFSKVKLATSLTNPKLKYAVKIIKKPAASKMSMLKTEVDILTKSDHPNIVRLYKIVDTPETLYLVMELLTGGELFDRIIQKGSYSEDETRKLVRIILESIAYLHSLGIAHRDLKPENILLSDDSDDADIKITDFGLSKIFADDAAGEVLMKTACGTPGYVAPEVLRHERYDKQVDLWSAGVIVYILLCGFPPFYGDNDAQMFKKIKAGQYKFLSPYWDHISKPAKDFVEKLLKVVPHERMTAAEALEHPWIVHGAGSGGADGAAAPERSMRKGRAAGGATDTQRAVQQPAPVAEEASDLENRLVDYQCERKPTEHRQLRRIFKLKFDAVHLGRFKCKANDFEGTLYPTTYDLCFLGTDNAKRLRVPYVDVLALQRVKKIMFGTKKNSIAVQTASAKIMLTNVDDRDALVQCVLFAGRACGVSIRLL